MAGSSSTPHVTLEVGEENPYPHPSNVYTPSFVTLKLSGRDEYEIWKTQMLCLLESHGMLGFIDGTHVSPQTSHNVSGKENVGEDHQTHHKLWRRSDALVKGWILGALSKQTLTYVVDRLKAKLSQERNVADFCGKEVWDELETMYAPAVVPPELLVVEDTLRDQERAEDQKRLYKATLGGEWTDVEIVLREREVTVLNKITNNGNTALHVAVGTSKKQWFLQQLLDVIPENTQLLDVRNSDGSTLLHVAAIVGNTEAVDILVQGNPDLLLAKDNEGHTPLAIALSNMHTETSKQLLKYINTDIEKDALFSGTSGDEHLVNVISSKDFGFAKDLMQHYKTLHTDAVLMVIAQNFPCELSILEEYIGTDMVEQRGLFCQTCGDCIFDFFERCSPYVPVLCILPCFIGIDYCLMLLLRIVRMLVSPFIKERVRIHKDAMELLEDACRLTINTKHSSSFPQYYTNPILEAARQNSYEVVQRIVSFFPSAIMSANEDSHNVIQYAVINRSEKVYNLLYEMSEHRNIYRTIKDSSGNNLLHLAARLAPSNKLNLISGAALQIQRELLWFKEVEGFVCPLSIIQKNSSGETPKMVFTREHKDLVIEGEKWMKSTAESYTITAALIITIVFAAAITVPGGSNQDTGIPIFTYKTAFTIFAISDAISLFAAVTSLLMFLSILTARFAEQDFLFKLPTKLIIGLATLFISTTAMIVAFAATLYLVFGRSHSRVLIPIAVLTCLPITSFVTLQFPLVLDLMSATYGRSIFVSPFIKERVRIHEDAMELLEDACRLTIKTKHPSSFPQYYANPILEAARQNSYEVVQRIVYFFPSAIMSANEDGHNVIQYVVINRSEKVYNLLDEMSEHRNICRTIKDSSGNNLLHLAARLAPPNKLNLISGAALQIQRELLWFKEVEGFVCPLSIIQKNSSSETPKMVFTREHKDLVIEGEKWMKSTAESYTITAALIITIVFAAAITVPGGSNQDTGIPIFTYKTAFTIFAISDAISLFAAVTSLLMFLSILTARFAEQDFLFKLPTKLIIGLATLFISTTAMIVAFAATLYLVFGRSHSRVLIPIAVLTCLPITSFATLQFPLVLDLMNAIYGRSIFGKKRDYSYWDREVLI